MVLQQTKKERKNPLYSDIAIETVAIIKPVFKLNNKRTEYFLKIHSHKDRKLNVKLPKTNSENIHLVIGR
ncbi:MAG: hypothetical protein ACK4SM_06320 [Aquificaceae bacterium]